MLGRLNSPRTCLYIVSLSYLFFILLRLMSHDFDPSFFITAGDRFVDPAATPRHIKVLENSYGYDGQFFYRLGLDPFTSKQTDFGIKIDKPSYRQQRIVYPLTAWIFSLGGNPVLLPAVMILINYFALCCISWLAARYYQSLNEHVLWSLVIPLYPGFILSLSRDLCEILSVLFIMAALLAYRRSRYLSFNLLIALAILTKETSLLVAVSAIICLVADGEKQRLQFSTALLFLIPIAIYIIWQFSLLSIWGDMPLLGGSMNIGVPFVGFIKLFMHSLALKTHFHRLWLIELVFILIFALSVGRMYFKSKISMHIRISWILYAILCFSLTNYVWIEDWAFMRALSEFFLLGNLILVGFKNKARGPVVIYSMVLWMDLFKNHAFY
jgi:hypothetical protein